jgi:pyrroloquinoline quinone (PQQ) biosynthesis protein C
MKTQVAKLVMRDRDEPNNNGGLGIMGSSIDEYYDRLEEEDAERFRQKAASLGMTPHQLMEHERLVENVRKGRDLYYQRKREDVLIELFLTNIDLIEK